MDYYRCVRTSFADVVLSFRKLSLKKMDIKKILIALMVLFILEITGDLISMIFGVPHDIYNIQLWEVIANAIVLLAIIVRLKTEKGRRQFA